MNLKLLPSILAFCSIAIFSACANDTKPAESTATTTTDAAGTVSVPTPTTTMEAPVVTAVPADGAPGNAVEPIITQVSPPTATPNPAKQEPPQNAAGVWHYTCPKGCKGGGGAAAPCAKCGATLAHNAAYHPAAPAGNPANPTANPAAQKPEPPQNKAGVWHYTCPDGCAGGGGAAAPCAKCGKTLAHNSVYHQ